MVRHRHPESLSRIYVSSRVVVTLGVFLLSAFLSRRDCGEEEEEGDVERAEKLLLWISGEDKLHYAVALRARTATHWQCVSVFLTGSGETFFLLLFFFIQVWQQRTPLLLHYRHLLELISPLPFLSDPAALNNKQT